MKFDSVSYVMGNAKGKGNIIIKGGTQYDFEDPSADGNIEIIEEDENGDQS